MLEHRFFRFGCLAAFLALLVHALWQRRLPEEEQNGGLVVIEFILMAVIVGILIATWALPALGDRVSEAMIGSGDREEETPASRAASLSAAGDFEGAIAEWAKIALQKPDDRHAVAEIARLYADRLEDPDSAIQTLTTSLAAAAWSPQDETFLRLRLSDLHLTARKDYEAARAQIDALVAKYPGSPQAAEAAQKRHAIDEAEFVARRAS